MNSLKITLSIFTETDMLLMDYPSIRGEELLDYSKKSAWNPLNAYIDARSQRLHY